MTPLPACPLPVIPPTNDSRGPTAFPATPILDPQESNVVSLAEASQTTQDVGCLFRHSGWRADRSRVEQALSELGSLTPEPGAPAVGSRRLLAFQQCGADAYVEQCTYAASTPNPRIEYRLRTACCKDRFCVPCSNARASRIRSSLLEHMHGKEKLSLITLTLKADGQSLITILDRAYAHFRSLRSLDLWRRAVHGGAAIIEAKVGKDGKRWNVHWHIVAEAGYLDKTDLSRAWLTITGDSFIVDIRRVGSLGGAVSYVTKYVTKAADSQVVRSPRHLREAILGFIGRRLVTTFGTWRGLQLLKDYDHDHPHQAPETAWQHVARLQDLVHASLTDPGALHILKQVFPRTRFIESG